VVVCRIWPHQKEEGTPNCRLARLANRGLGFLTRESRSQRLDFLPCFLLTEPADLAADFFAVALSA
jgi:hypothetical protein